VFPVRYELNSHILLRRYLVFKGLMWTFSKNVIEILLIISDISHDKRRQDRNLYSVCVLRAANE
jgi:hypothetical protein